MSEEDKKQTIKTLLLKLKKKEFKKEHYFMILLVGVLLFVIALPVKEENPDTEIPTENETGENTTEKSELSMAEQYAAQLEDELKQMLSGVRGVGTVEVMITLKYTEGVVVEKDKEQQSAAVTETDAGGGTRISSETARNEKTVYTQGNEQPLVVKQSMPEIEGVLIVCTGGDSPILKTEITEAICALFKVDAHKIRVMKMK